MQEKIEEAKELLCVYHLPKLKPGALSNQKRPILRHESEAVVKVLPSKKSSGLNGVYTEFYQIFMEELLILNSFHSTQCEGTLQDQSVKSLLF